LIEKLGKKELVREIGIDDFLANLSPAERKRLIQRLNTEPKE
jgi:high-affinity K+ transport system ATPase subunit B